jgi:glycerol-3-phosphate acyltransferase PlsY
MAISLVDIGLIITAYLSGSLTFAIWITRAIKGVDVRDSGSHHATTTNTIRQAGWLPGGAVMILDIAKGYLPVLLALKFGSADWVIAVVAMAAVAGHCWPIFAEFRGGMGLATAGGAYLAVYPFSFLVALGILIILVLILKHSARGAFFLPFVTLPVLYLMGIRGVILLVVITTGVVLSIRFLSDWKREYSELWLDRKKEE